MNQHNRMRRFSTSSWAFFAAAATLLSVNDPCWGQDIPRYRLKPIVAPGADRRATYSLPPEYTIGTCGSIPTGIEIKDGGTAFNARPLPSGSDLTGYTLSVKKGNDCETIQVLLLPWGNAAEQNQFQQLPGLWRLWPLELPQPSRAKSIYEDDDIPPDTSRDGMRDDSVPLPSLYEPLHEPDAWVFATATSRPEEEVKLPTMGGKQQFRCENGQVFDKFVFGSERTRTIQISPDGSTCTTPKDQKVILLVNDAMGFVAADRKKLIEGARIEPQGTESLKFWLPGLLAKRPELRSQNNYVLPVNRSSVGPTWGQCMGQFCPLFMWYPSWSADDAQIEVKLSTPASRQVERGHPVYDAQGKPIDLDPAWATLGAISTWVWPHKHIPVHVSIAPNKRTRIPVEGLAPRMLSNHKDMDCRTIGNDGKEKTVKDCVEFERDQDGKGALLVKHDEALKVLGVAAATLLVDLEGQNGPILWSTGNGQEVVSFELSTDECEYSFLQLTETIAGTLNGDVIYWVMSAKNAETCLRAPLQVRPSNAASAQFKLGSTTWESPENEFDSSKGRALRVHIQSIPDGTAAATYSLAATFGRTADAPLAPLSGGENEFSLHVGRGIDDTEMTVDVEMGEGLRPPLLANQPHLAVARTNHIFLASPAGRPWRLRLASMSNHHRVPPSPSVGVGSILLSSDPRVLPSATVDGRTAYFLEGTVATETRLAFRAELDGNVSQFLRPEGKRLLEGLNDRSAKLLLDNPLVIGHVEKTLQKSTKVYRLPWDLRQAMLKCGKDAAIGKSVPKNKGTSKSQLAKGDDRPGIRTSSPTRGMHREDYRHCHVLVPSKDQAFRQAVSGGDGPIAWGAQHLVVMAIKNGVQQEIEVANLRGYKPDRMHDAFRLDIRDDLLEKLGETQDYSDVQFVVRHVQPSDTSLRTELVGAYIPGSLETARASELRARTRLMPDWSASSVSDDDSTSMGFRWYISGAANLALYQTSDPGIGSTSSSAYASAVKAKFGYGVIGTIERWNFSDNKPWWPVLAPQLNVGVFGPTDFDQPGGWKQWSVIYGLTFRLPAASTPKPDATEAQTGLILWGRFTRGDRDLVTHSLLMGLNVSIGAGP